VTSPSAGPVGVGPGSDSGQYGRRLFESALTTEYSATQAAWRLPRRCRLSGHVRAVRDRL